MNKRIVIDPVTRIEGHLRIEAETSADGRLSAPPEKVFAWLNEYVAVVGAVVREHGGIGHILARHVEGASHMAEGYTRAKAGNTADVERLFARCRNYLGVVARAQVEETAQVAAISRPHLPLLERQLVVRQHVGQPHAVVGAEGELELPAGRRRLEGRLPHELVAEVDAGGAGGERVGLGRLDR